MPFTSWFISTTEIGWFFFAYIIVTNYSHDLVKRTGQFTVNNPREGMEKIVEYCGSVSGRDHDKFSESGLTVVASRYVKPPIIGACGVHMECETRSKSSRIDLESRPLFSNQR